MICVKILIFFRNEFNFIVHKGRDDTNILRRYSYFTILYSLLLGWLKLLVILYLQHYNAKVAHLMGLKRLRP